MIKNQDIGKQRQEVLGSIPAPLGFFPPCEPYLFKINAQRFLFTPIPCTNTSLLLDGWPGIIIITFIYMDTQDHAIYCVWIHFIPTSLYLRRGEKHLV